jgi:endonuclease G
MAHSQLDNIRADPELRTELERRWRDDSSRPVRRAIVIPPGATTPGLVPAPRRPGRRIPAPTMDELLAANIGTEAIILRFGRPSLLIQRDTFEVPASDTWKARLDPTRPKLEAAIRSVGRVEVRTLGVPFIGTAWIIAPGVAVTNRHVADVFAFRRTADEFSFRLTPEGDPYEADVDFREEVGTEAPFEVDLDRILYIEEDRPAASDVALVGVKPRGDRRLPPPIVLFDGRPQARQTIAAIGYPAADARNNQSDQDRIFGNVFNVKRLAPGEVTGILGQGEIFTHDCTTLGGNSGSVLVDVETGTALGLHFAGIYRKNNYALSAEELRRILAKVGTPAVITSTKAKPQRPAAEGVGLPSAPELRRRRGYDPEFLGPMGEQRVPMPSLGPRLRGLALPVRARGRALDRHLLTYEHFSLVMHRDRRMAIFTAVNVDGDQQQRLKRTADPWALDPRIPATAQIGDDLYANNQLDRGHLVRRLDPTWGPTAETAERDTFFFTNCTPQHSRFNQALWVELEDYILDSADTFGFRACAFTGPVFAEADGVYRGVRIPTAYWKVVAMLRTEDGRLSVTGYVVSQADLVTNLEFAYGQVRTYQVPVAQIASMTGLDFGPLAEADPLAAEEGIGIRELGARADIRL